LKNLSFSFLFLYVTLTELYLGALLALCFRALIAPRWLEPMAPAFTRLQRLAYGLAPLFLVLCTATPYLYPWTEKAAVGTPFRQWYLSQGGFTLRGIFYWAIWLGISFAARKKLAWAGSVGVVLILFSATFASYDWLLSLEDGFGSTIFGTIFLLSGLLLAFGCAGFSSAFYSKPDERQDQGSIHLALLCVWTYLSFMQFLIIWSGNLPREVKWYFLREQHGWALLPVFFAIGQFFVPMLLLFQSWVKRSFILTRALTLLTVVWQILFCYWEIAPEHLPGFSITGFDLLAFALIGIVIYLNQEPQCEPA
jgi:hypothetical protein